MTAGETLYEIEERISAIYRTYSAVHGGAAAPEVGELARLWAVVDAELGGAR